MTLTEYLNKAGDYLKSKLPDVPEHTVAEIAAYLTNLMAIATRDEVNKVIDAYMGEIKRRERHEYPATPASPGSGRPPDIRKCGTCEHRNGNHTECTACNEKNGFKYYVAMNVGGVANG